MGDGEEEAEAVPWALERGHPVVQRLLRIGHGGLDLLHRVGEGLPVLGHGAAYRMGALQNKEGMQGC